MPLAGGVELVEVVIDEVARPRIGEGVVELPLRAEDEGVDGSTVGATPESGGVAATGQSNYSYYSADMVVSSMFTEGDVGIVGLRYAVSDSTDVYSINIDTRFPIGGRSWRINPRLRIDYREINTDQSTQWIYSPSLRVQYRMGRRIRLQFEAGKQFSVRDMATTDIDRESYFVNIGYQFFY